MAICNTFPQKKKQNRTSQEIELTAAGILLYNSGNKPTVPIKTLFRFYSLYKIYTVVGT